MRSLAALAVGLAAFVVWSPAAASGPAPEIERRDAVEAAVVRELNRVRAARRLAPVRVAPSLRRAARGHSRAMLTLGFFGHESFDGTRFSVRIKRHYGDRGWATWSVGEALLSSTDPTIEAAAVVRAWLGSPSHRELILSRGWRDTGIGVLYAPVAPAELGGGEAIVVTADFGLRERAAELP